MKAFFQKIRQRFLTLRTSKVWLYTALAQAFVCIGQPIIGTHPFSQSVEAGARVTLRVVATGEGQLTYQWHKDGVEMPGVTNAIQLVAMAQVSDAGRYSVSVSNARGKVTSGSARLSVHVPRPLLNLTNRWKFNQSGEDLGTNWKEAEFDDLNWMEGAGLFYNETGSLPAPRTTLLDLTNTVGKPINTYYFRTHFDLPEDAIGMMLLATNYIDDGAVFYLNGAEIGRFRIPNGPVTSATKATIAVERKGEVAVFSTAPMVRGDNVLAVEVHQESVVNADVVFGMILSATTLAPLLPDMVVPPPPPPHIEAQEFAATDCEVHEGCAIVGKRRLLRFDIEARNAGTGDLVLGSPTGNPQFYFDNCHGHYHYDNFVAFRLLDRSGAMVSVGKKIGFGLADVDRWDTTNGPPNARFDGDVQYGISRGWSDIYSFQVSCQYVDITEVPAGSYILELEIDPHTRSPKWTNPTMSPAFQ